MCRCRLTELNWVRTKIRFRPRMDAVGHGNIDQSILAGDRNGRLAPRLGQRIQPSAPASAQDQRDHPRRHNPHPFPIVTGIGTHPADPRVRRRPDVLSGQMTDGPIIQQSRNASAVGNADCRVQVRPVPSRFTSRGPCSSRSPCALRRGPSRSTACRAAPRAACPPGPSTGSRGPSSRRPGNPWMPSSFFEITQASRGRWTHPDDLLVWIMLHREDLPAAESSATQAIMICDVVSTSNRGMAGSFPEMRISRETGSSALSAVCAGYWRWYPSQCPRSNVPDRLPKWLDLPGLCGCDNL